MTERLDLPRRFRDQLEALLRDHLPDVEVWAYGSRVNGRSHDASDLDLVLRSPTLEPLGDGYFDLLEAIEKSNIPILIQAHDWARLPKSFHPEIARDHVVLQERTKQTTSGDWCDVILGGVCTKIGSGATPRGGKEVYLRDGPYALIRSQNIYNTGFARDGLAFISDEHSEALHNVEVLPEDVLLNITGDSVARVCQVDPIVLPARVNQHVAIIRPDPEKLDAAYLRYYLAAPDVQAMLLSWAGSGGTRNALTKQMIESFEVRAPTNLDEQRAIAHILGTLDDKIELNRRVNETLEEMARALFKSWFVDFDPVRAKMEGRWRRGESLPGLPAEFYDLFPDRLVASELGEIPKGWEVKALDELTRKPQYGYTESAKDAPIGPKFVRITDINKKAWIEWELVPHCEITEEDFGKYRLYKNDILIARMADPGHGCMIEEDQQAVFASYLIRFRPLQKRYARFLQYWLRSDAYWELVQERGAGTTRLSLNAKVLSVFPLVVPTNPLPRPVWRSDEQSSVSRGNQHQGILRPRRAAGCAVAEAGVGGGTRTMKLKRLR